MGTAPSVWYTFVGDGNSNTLSLCGSSYDTKIGVFSGTCAALVCVGGNDDACGLQSSVTVPTTLGVTYYVIVTGFGTNSGAFTLTRTCLPPVPNDDCSGAININCGQTIAGTTAGATSDPVAGTCTTNLTTAPGVWYKFTGTGATTTLSLCGSGYDTKIGVFSGTCAALTCVAGNDDACGLQSSVTVPTTFGTTYYVLVTGFGTASGSFNLAMTCVYPNEDCSGAININCGQTINGTTAGATADAVGTCSTSLGTAPGVWYKFTGDGAANTLSLCGSGFDTKIGIFSGTCGALVCVGGNDDFAGCGLQSQITVPTSFGTTYYVLVTGFGTASGNYTLTRTCLPQCTGVPSPGFITGPTAIVCTNTSQMLTLSGYTTGVSGVTFQWKQSATSGGPYTSISGATNNTYTFTTNATAYFVCTVTCQYSSMSSTTSEFVVNVDKPIHTSITAIPSTFCTPGPTAISATVANGITVGGIGVIGTNTTSVAIPDNNPAGVNSAITLSAVNIPNAASLKVRINANHSWVGDLVFKLTSPCGVTYLFDRPGVPASTFGNSDNLGTSSASTPPPAVYTFDVGGATVLPETTGGSGFIASGVYKPSDAAGNAHNWAGITFPCAAAGTWTLNVSDNGGGDLGTLVDWQILGPVSGNYTHTLTGPGTITQNASTGTNNSTGNFSVTNLPAGTHTFSFTSTDVMGCSVTSPISVTVNQTPVGSASPQTICSGQTTNIPLSSTVAGSTFSWTAAIQTAPSGGTITGFSNCSTGCGSSIAHTLTNTGTNTGVVRYTVTNTTASGCTNTFTVDVTVNALPSILVQPVAAASPICPGFNANYSVTAGGTGITYQWQLSTAGTGGPWNNIANGPQYSGVTTNALTVLSVTAAQNGNLFRCVVTGTCTPSATSNAVTLVVATAPTITTQPTSRTVCSGTNTSFTVVASGVPSPTIYQWQVSTNAGSTWTNLTTGGSYTTTFTITGTTTTQSGNWYRCVVTNICGQTVNSANAILTVNPTPVVTTTPFAGKICLSDGPIALSGSPVGGSWSGIGVSGFNFVPASTAVGTYALTYTYTNTFGCTATATLNAKVEECQERVRLLRDNAIILYPNPNNGNFNIRINSVLYNYMGMYVYSTSGQLVKSQIFKGLTYGTVLPIDLTFLPSGTYMVKFFYDDGIRTSEKTFPVVIGRN